MFFYNPCVRKWGLTPSTACGRSPSLEEGGLGASRSLSKSLIQPRVQGRNPGRFNGGYGVPRGFKREKSKFPPNPLGLAERVYSFHRLRAVPLPRGGRSGALRALSKPRIQPRVQGRNPARFNGGYGVPRGFKGEKSKSPPNPLGLAERVYSFHRPRGGPPPSRREVWGLRRSRSSALTSIAYRGFAVAPITLRAPSRKVVITSEINGRAMRAPTEYSGATNGCKCI